MNLEIEVRLATNEIMEFLEDKGIISRLAPGRDTHRTADGATSVETLYKTDIQYGSHKLIAVTVNTIALERLTAHPDREDFLLIGDEAATEMILTISLLKKDILEEKLKNKSLTDNDFIAIQCKMNDPNLSFFTMNPYFPHAETCKRVSTKPPSFYVSEPADLPELHVSLDPYSISFKEAAK